MQTVKRSWLLWINWLYVFIDVLLFAAYLLFSKLSIAHNVVSYWGITPLILVLAGIHFAYATIIYPLYSKRQLWISSVLSFTLTAILAAALIETGSSSNYLYRAIFASIVLLSGAVGPLIPIAILALMWLLFIFTLTSVLQPTIHTLWVYALINSINTILGLAGWLIFKPHYLEAKEASNVAALADLLQQEQLKSGAMLESITDGVLIVNTSGTVQVINQSAATMLGWTQDEAKQLDYRSLLAISEEEGSPQKPLGTAITTTLSTHKPTQRVSLIKTRNNRQIYVDIVASPIFQTTDSKTKEGGEPPLVGVVAVLRNVDTQKRQEQQRSDFISTASHEMRTPVAAVQGFIELALNSKVSTIDDKAREYLLKAHTATENLGKLFQDLLTASKSEDGRLTNAPQVININEFLKEVIEPEVIAAEQKGLKVVFEDQTGQGKRVAPLLYVNVDKDRLKEVILNLFENAIKYTKQGMVTVGASMKEQSVVIRIADTGFGIAAEDVPHLFQKFYRTDNSATREIGGTGLGLYISKQIIEMMGGRIWVESTLGAGSTFFVQLPRMPAELIDQLNPGKT